MNKTKTKIIAIIGMIIVMTGCKVPEIITLKQPDIQVEVVENSGSAITMKVVENINYFQTKEAMQDYFKGVSLNLDKKEILIKIDSDIRFSVSASDIKTLKGRLILRDKWDTFDFIPEKFAFESRVK